MVEARSFLFLFLFSRHYTVNPMLFPSGNPLLRGFVFAVFNPSGFLPDISLFTQAPILVWFDGTIIDMYYPLDYVLQCLCFVMIGGSAW